MSVLMNPAHRAGAGHGARHREGDDRGVATFCDNWKGAKACKSWADVSEGLAKESGERLKEIWRKTISKQGKVPRNRVQAAIKIAGAAKDAVEKWKAGP